MIEALILICIVALIGWGVTVVLAKAGAPDVLRVVIWVFLGIICLLILYRAFGGGNLHL